MKDWKYAELSHEAKVAGGPDVLLNTVKEEGIQEGKDSMKSEMAIIGLVGVVMGGLLLKGYNSAKERFEKKRKSKEAAEKAEAIIIEEMSKNKIDDLSDDE